MDHSWLSLDYFLDTKLGSIHYIYKDKACEPFIDIEKIDNNEKLASCNKVQEILKSKIKKKELPLLTQQFAFQGNYITGDNYKYTEPINLLVPTDLKNEIDEFRIKRKVQYLSTAFLLYLPAITQYTYWYVINSSNKDFDFVESLKAIDQISDARSIVIKNKRNYHIKSLLILDSFKEAVASGLQKIDTWKHWNDYLTFEVLDSKEQESKIFQIMAYTIDIVLKALRPSATNYKRDLIIGHVIAWSNIPVEREGLREDLEGRDAETLRKWAQSLKAAYRRNNPLTIKKSTRQKSVSKSNIVLYEEETKNTTPPIEGLKELMIKHGLERIEYKITDFLNLIPSYIDPYPGLKLDESVIKLNSILPNYGQSLNKHLKAHIEDLLIEPISFWPFDLIEHVNELDSLIQYYERAPNLERSELISKILFLGDVFINESISPSLATVKVDFWLSLNRNINLQFPK